MEQLELTLRQVVVDNQPYEVLTEPDGSLWLRVSDELAHRIPDGGDPVGQLPNCRRSSSPRRRRRRPPTGKTSPRCSMKSEASWTTSNTASPRRSR